MVGTSGKGSITKMFAVILKEAGYKVGATYSPQLISFEERIMVNGRAIGKKELAALLGVLKPKIEKLAKSGEMPSYYEISIALALKYFSEQRCDWVVLEAAMGGRYDCTNVLGKQEMVLVSKIGFDHQRFLGNTLEEIAFDKAGIIKKGSKVFVIDQKESVLEVFGREARQKKVSLELIKESTNNVQISYSGTTFEYKNEQYKTPLIGLHQAINALLVLRAAEELVLNNKIVQKALRKAYLPGRMQVLPGEPKVVLDVAHNPQKMRAVAETLEILPHKNLCLVLGIMADKDVEGALDEILPLASKACFALPRTSGRKVADFSRYASLAEKFKVKYDLCANPHKALEVARKESKKDDLICVTGSFAVVAEILKSGS